MSIRPLSRGHYAMDRAVKSAVMDSAGGISYADIHDRSTETRKLQYDLDKAMRKAGGNMSARDVAATIGTSRKNTTKTGIK
jgi:hypothetical protein